MNQPSHIKKKQSFLVFQKEAGLQGISPAKPAWNEKAQPNGRA
jgi:hypothetical protein